MSGGEKVGEKAKLAGKGMTFQEEEAVEKKFSQFPAGHMNKVYGRRACF